MLNEIIRVVIPGIALGLFFYWIMGERQEEYIKPLDPRNWNLELNKNTLIALAAVFGLIIVTALGSSLIVGTIESGGETAVEEDNYATEMAEYSAAIFFVALVLMPIPEEWLFRMVLIEEIKRRWGENRWWIAALISASAFALAHLANTGVHGIAFLMFFFGGLMYALIYIRYGLGSAVGVHIGVNLIPYVVPVLV